MKEHSIGIDSAPPLKASSSLKAEAGLWLIVLTIVVLLVSANVRRRAAGGAADPFNDLRIRILAQQAIGLKAFTSGTANATDVQTRRIIREIENQTQAPQDRVRVAIVAGYLEGKPAGLSGLNALSGTQTSPEVAGDAAALRTIYVDGNGALQSGEAERLIRRYGYFGRMALATDASQGSDERKAIEVPARRMLLLLGMLAAGLLALIAVSLGLSVVAIVCWWTGKISAGYTAGPAGNPVYLEAFALYLVLFTSMSLVVRALGLANPSWNWLAWLIIPMAMLWIAKRSGDTGNWRVALGWYSGRGWLWECAAGIAGYLACLPIIAVGVALTLLLIRLTGVVPRDAVTPLLQGSILPLYAIACVFAPVLEETMFRGALFNHLRSRWGWMASAAAVSFVFAVIHPQGWVAVPALGSIAMALAALREWRGSIIASMAAHAFNNFMAITAALVLLRTGSGS